MESAGMVALVFLAALIGGLATALLGWAKQDPPESWNGRKFMVSAITAVVGGAVIAVGFKYTEITSVPLALIAALLAGVGPVALATNISGAIAARARLKKSG